MAQTQKKSLQGQLNLDRHEAKIPKTMGTTEASKFIKFYTNKDISSQEIREKAKKGKFEIECNDGSAIAITVLNKSKSGKYLLGMSLIFSSYL